MASEKKEKESGFLEVAEFVTVVYFDPAEYPNGVRKFKTARDGKEEIVSKTKD